MKKFNSMKLGHTPLGIVIRLAVVVMVAEFALLLLLGFVLKPMLGKYFPAIFWDYADSILLSVIFFPTSFYLVFRPMKEQQLILAKKNIELHHLAAQLREKETKLLEQHRKTLENRERMTQIEKLTSLGTMVGGVAHEINNPLMGILNYVEYAKDKATDTKSFEVLGKALHEINRIKKIVGNMLVFIRSESAHQESCSVRETVKQTLALLEGEFTKNAVQVRVELPEDLPPVRCGAGSLQQVLINLLLNARDAIAEQAEQRITIAGTHENGKITLSVCDNGPCVPDEIRQKIFDPFFSTKPVGKGTGLGLSVSRRLVEEVGGSVSLHREHGYGCCFQVEFASFLNEEKH